MQGSLADIQTRAKITLYATFSTKVMSSLKIFTVAEFDIIFMVTFYT